MPDKSAAVNPRKASDDARAVLHSLPRDPARIQDIASAAGVRTRSTQAWVSCFAVLGKAQMHDVGRRRPLWSAADLPPKAQWLMAVMQLPEQFSRREAESVGIHSLLLRAAEVAGMLRVSGLRKTATNSATLWEVQP